MADPELEWMARSKRRGALTLIVLGLVLAIGGAGWVVQHRDFQPVETIAAQDMGDGTRSSELTVHKGLDPRIIGGAVGAVGILLAIAGGVLMTRVRRMSSETSDTP